MKSAHFILGLSLLSLASPFAYGSDPSPLQDFCVAIDDPKDAVFVNGKFCKDPKLAKAEDFYYSGLNMPRNTSNPLGSTVTPVNVAQIPGLNTLGISLGTLTVGFVTSNPENHLITKVLYPGDVFVFPIGLVHFQFNNGKTNAVALAGFSSQNPGVVTMANAVFGSNPPINPDVIVKAFQLDKDVKNIQFKFWWANN
ncbi:Germin-like protein subfamily 1 member 13 [Hibiscus syriacus]|uniref:Germin-like protein n=1 Tax=Hibiscus syriacus TaxID=106335 RepID=A0A6A3A5V6_HIBSY|nr:Germin-like protein subfamily 1 member 13 [Hibiscus syriacus]